MSHLVRCPECQCQMALSDEVFAQRIAGRLVNIACKKCKAWVAVDGRAAAPPAPPRPPASKPRPPAPAAPRPRSNPLPARLVASQDATATPVAVPRPSSTPKPPVLPQTAPTPARPVPPRAAAPSPAAPGDATTTPVAVPRPRRSVLPPLQPPSHAAPAPHADPPVASVSQEEPTVAPLTARSGSPGGDAAAPEPRTAGTGAAATETRRAEIELTPPAYVVAAAKQNPTPAAPPSPVRPSSRRRAALATAAVLSVGAAAAGLALFGVPGATTPEAPSATVAASEPSRAASPNLASPGGELAGAATPDSPAPAEPPADPEPPTQAGAAAAASPDAPPSAGVEGAAALPGYVDAPAVDRRVDDAVRRAERCHPGGHAVGSAELTLTIEPTGHVSEATLVGEPLQSAPVGRCILDQGRAVLVPAFSGPAFRVRRNVTLR